MAVAKRKGLGKGLDSLIPKADVIPTAAPTEQENKPNTFVKISRIEPNKDQPRKNFDEDALQELAESIKQFGVIQPLIVQKRDDFYEIIAGETPLAGSQNCRIERSAGHHQGLHGSGDRGDFFD